MTLFFPLLPHLQLPGSLFSHIPGPSISKQSQETQSGVLSFLRTFKHNMNSFPIACLCQLLFCAFVTLLSHCVNWMLLGHALLSAVHRAPRPCASVQFSPVAPSCPTLCDPMNRSTPGLPVQHQLPEFTQTHVH